MESPVEVETPIEVETPAEVETSVEAESPAEEEELGSGETEVTVIDLDGYRTVTEKTKNSDGSITVKTTIYSISYGMDGEIMKLIELSVEEETFPPTDEPEEPTVPEEPDEPTVSEEPDEPTVPEEPDEPTAPEEPDEPAVPEEPDEPAAPEEPDEPAVPEEPTIPEEPVEEFLKVLPVQVIELPQEEVEFPKLPNENTEEFYRLDEIPQTGDASQIVLYITLLVASTILLVITSRKIRR